MNVLAIGNQKGGTAKTTTAAALAVLLSRRGQRVHVIDMDPQASLTAAFGVSDEEGLLYQALKEKAALPVVRLSGLLTLTPSSIDLAAGENEFIGMTAREKLLKKSLEKTESLGQGSTIIVDSPPSLGVLSLNCLVAARALAVVVQPGGFELRALAYLEQVIQGIKEDVNPGLMVAGAVMTNYQPRRAINDQVRAEMQRHYTDLGQVRSDSKMLYATTEGSILQLKISSAMDDYEQVLNKLIEVCPWLKS